MNKYRDKSDFEINLRVAQIIFTDSEYDVIKQSMEVVKFQNGNGKGTCHAFDPCNNPADAMPIVIENGISSLFNDDEWICSVPYTEFLSINENLCRAAMEVFLMMKEAENES
ncbi:phage protein NinX family protein [Morganella morganii]|uniref:phage protein NinX family protein n=1 Tax=Morganella morganii TaxID=582 RepID=UPI0034E501DD